MPYRHWINAPPLLSQSPQNPFWVIPENYVDFANTSPPAVNTLNPNLMSPFEGANNGIWDECGNLIVYTVNGHVFDGNHNQLTTGNGLEGFKANENFEIPIVPVPGTTDEFLIIYTRENFSFLFGLNFSPAFVNYNSTTNTITSSRFVFVDFPAPTGELIPCTVFLSVRFAVSQEFGTPARRNLWILGEVGTGVMAWEVWKADITKAPLPGQSPHVNGLLQIDCSTPEAFIDMVTSSEQGTPMLDWERTSLELELSPDGKWLVWGEMGVAQGEDAAIHLLSTATNGHSFMQVGAAWHNVFGLEFDKTSTLIAVSGDVVPPLNNNASIIAFPYWYIGGPTSSFYTVPNTLDYAHSMIELGYNNKLYASSLNNLLAFRMDLAGYPNVIQVTPAFDVPINNSTEIPNFLTVGPLVAGGILVDQIDGEIYVNPECFGGGDPGGGTDPGSYKMSSPQNTDGLLYPNPVRSGSKINLRTINASVIPTVHDHLGKTLHVEAVYSEGTWQIMIPELSPGKYIVRQNNSVWFFSAY